MTTEEREPFEIHSSRWYDKPLDYKVIIYGYPRSSSLRRMDMSWRVPRNYARCVICWLPLLTANSATRSPETGVWTCVGFPGFCR